MKKIFLILLIFNFANIYSSIGQIDPHFSQYYALPLWLNPAMAGNIDGDSKLTVNHRRQWVGIDASLITTAASAELSKGKNFGYGISFIDQNASAGSYHNINASFTFSYKAFLDPTHILSSGFQIGVLNKWLDVNNFKFGNQYNPFIGYDPSLQSNEVFNMNKSLQMDISAGLMYYDATPNKKANTFLGVSIFHANQPKDAFLKSSGKEILPARYLIHGGVRVKASDNIDVTPHFILMQQGRASEVSGGVLMNINIMANTNLIPGISYRYKEAFVPTIGLENKNLMLGFSYDIGTSTRSSDNVYRSAFEISLSLINKRKENEPKFVCPKL